MSASARESALKLLFNTFYRNGYSNYLLENLLNSRPDMEDNDKRFLKALYFGVMRQSIFLDYHLARKCRSPLEKLPARILLILRIGLYQIVFMERVPPHAVVDESVKLARRYGHRGTAGLVNALLRGFAAENRDAFRIDINTESSIEEISAAVSHPAWLVKRYLGRYGFDGAMKILRANNEEPPASFRVDDLRTLEESEAEFAKNRFEPLGAELKNAPGSLVRPLVKFGVIAPQDQSSLIAASLLAGARGRLLELCCGRGNKTAAITRLADEDAKTVSADISFAKLHKLRHAGFRHNFPVCADTARRLPFKARFEHLFLDAPCSNLGTLRRHPEIRHRRTEQELERFAKLQSDMLSASADCVDRHGELLYAVCSFEPEETDEVVNRFLEHDKRFRPVDIGEKRPELASAGLTDGCFLRIITGRYGMDGFFAALLKKTE